MVEEVIERPPAVNESRLATPKGLTSEERTWAALAHASTLLTVFGTFLSGGVGVFILPFVPLFIYFAYREKSQYVAEQAMQALAFQLLATVGFVVAVVAGVLIIVAAWAITALLSIILIGLLLIPVALLITLIVPAVLALIPFVFAGLGLVGTIEAANGKDYRAPFIGDAVIDWVRGLKPNQTPMV
jgi:hypothetical protein